MNKRKITYKHTHKLHKPIDNQRKIKIKAHFSETIIEIQQSSLTYNSEVDLSDRRRSYLIVDSTRVHGLVRYFHVLHHQRGRVRQDPEERPRAQVASVRPPHALVERPAAGVVAGERKRGVGALEPRGW